MKQSYCDCCCPWTVHNSSLHTDRMPNKQAHLGEDQGSEHARIDGSMPAKGKVQCHSYLGHINGAHSDPLGCVHPKGHWQRLQAHLSAEQGANSVSLSVTMPEATGRDCRPVFLQSRVAKYLTIFLTAFITMESRAEDCLDTGASSPAKAAALCYNKPAFDKQAKVTSWLCPSQWPHAGTAAQQMICWSSANALHPVETGWHGALSSVALHALLKSLGTC